VGTAGDFIDLVGGDMSLYSENLDTEDRFAQDQSLKQAEKDMKMEQEAKKYQRSVPGPHNTKSRIDGMDISKFQGPQFCYGSGQRQIDIDKIRICKPCGREKIQIIKHGRHEEFADIEETTVDDGKGGVRREPKQLQGMSIAALRQLQSLLEAQLQGMARQSFLSLRKRTYSQRCILASW
jgi:hypothetical protein